MLKLTYTEIGFHLERLAQSPERLVAMRVILAMRVGQNVCVQPSSAAFLLPNHLSAWPLLAAEVRQVGSSIISLDAADDEYTEVSLGGTWISQDGTEDHGVFVTVLSDRLELLLLKLWQEAQTNAFLSR